MKDIRIEIIKNMMKYDQAYAHNLISSAYFNILFGLLPLSIYLVKTYF